MRQRVHSVITWVRAQWAYLPVFGRRHTTA